MTYGILYAAYHITIKRSVDSGKQQPENDLLAMENETGQLSHGSELQIAEKRHRRFMSLIKSFLPHVKKFLPVIKKVLPTVIKHAPTIVNAVKEAI